MKKRKWIIACAILAAITVGSFALQLMPASLAHSKNTVSWQGAVYDSGNEIVKSDLLSESGQDVILNDISSGQRTIAINISSDVGPLSGSFSCQTGEYLTTSFDNTQVYLSGGGKQTVNLTLTVTEAGKNLTSDKTEKVHVVWTSEQGQQLSADILVPLASNGETVSIETKETLGQSVDSLITNWTPTFSDKIPLGIEIVPGDGCKSVILKWNDGEFPELLRYTIKNKSTVLYDGGYISIPNDSTSIVLLDFSNTGILPDKEYSLSANAYSDQLNTQKIVVDKSGEGPFSDPGKTKVLTKTETLNFALREWQGGDRTVTLYHLETDESGNAAWVTLDENSGIIIQPDGEVLLSEPYPPAGTYQIEIIWKFCTNSIAELRSEFFIQYDGGTSSASTAA